MGDGGQFALRCDQGQSAHLRRKTFEQLPLRSVPGHIVAHELLVTVYRTMIGRLGAVIVDLSTTVGVLAIVGIISII